MFKDYYKKISNAIYDIWYGERLRILASQEMIQRLPRALVQVKVGNTSANVLNEIR